MYAVDTGPPAEMGPVKPALGWAVQDVSAQKSLHSHPCLSGYGAAFDL